ncbi:hypothetical protein ACFQX7_01850 [Luedemannella flava]
MAVAIAILGESTTSLLISEFLNLDTASTRQAINHLVAMGLLTGLRFRSEESRLVVLGDVNQDDLPQVHRRAAEMLHESGAPAAAVASQLVAARGLGKASWWVPILREAAQDAVAAGRIPEAILNLRCALSIATVTGQKAQITAALVDAQWELDPRKAARQLPGLSEDVRAGLLTGRDAMVPVQHLLWWGEFDQVEELLKAAEANEGRAHADGSPAVSSPDATMTRLWFSLCCPGQAAAHELTDRAEVPVGAPPTWSGPMAALNLLLSVAGLTLNGTDVQALEAVLHPIGAGRPITPALFALVELVQAGRVDEALRW